MAVTTGPLPLQMTLIESKKNIISKECRVTKSIPEQPQSYTDFFSHHFPPLFYQLNPKIYKLLELPAAKNIPGGVWNTCQQKNLNLISALCSMLYPYRFTPNTGTVPAAKPRKSASFRNSKRTICEFRFLQNRHA